MKSKKCILILIALLCFKASTLFSQKPEPVYGFAKIQQPLSWYKTQLDLWKLETAKDPKNALAWYYSYKASRNLLRLDTTDKRPKSVRHSEHESLITAMGAAVPESFEYNLVMWGSSGLDASKIEYLNKAEKLGANRTEHLEFLLIQAELDRDIEKRNLIAKRSLDAGLQSAGFMYYTYNTLAGLKPNAILFTSGDNDTYPAWYLQSMGFRTDVTVINFSLFGIKKYRDQICKDLGAKIWPKDPYDAKIGTDSQQTCLDEFNRNIVPFLAENTKNLPVYIALTADGPILENLSNQLYLTGLAYEYSTKKIDNIAILRRNFEHNYLLDYIFHPYYTDMSENHVKRVNANYIVPMLDLWKHYSSAGDEEKAAAMKNQLVILLQGRPEEKELLEILNSRH